MLAKKPRMLVAIALANNAPFLRHWFKHNGECASDLGHDNKTGGLQNPDREHVT